MEIAICPSPWLLTIPVSVSCCWLFTCAMAMAEYPHVQAALRLCEGKVSATDLNLLKCEPCLVWCSINERLNNKICLCCDLTEFVDEEAEFVVQTKIRMQYLTAVANGNHGRGNAFLRGCMVMKAGSRRIEHHVPLIKDEFTVRVFILCCQQFKRLFHLTESRLDRLRRAQKQFADSNCNEHFGYQEGRFGVMQHNYNQNLCYIYRDWQAIECKRIVEERMTPVPDYNSMPDLVE